jgi:histidyl-tRNA synthetase
MADTDNNPTGDSSNRIDLRLPKGTKDYAGDEYRKMEFLKRTVRSIFALNGGEYLETPVFELTQILTNKYGEDEKLIYNLECSKTGSGEEDGEEDGEEGVEEGGEENGDDGNIKGSMFKEELSLRYDLTVPLVRYCILNRIDKMRRCSIGKVYRRETTSASNKRLREFYQADFDFVGGFGELLPELSIFSMIQKFFADIGWKDYEIIYNYRQILNLCIERANIDNVLFTTVCSSIDKLDKKEEAYVRAELLEKGLTEIEVVGLFEAVDDLKIVPPDVKKFDDRFRECLQNMSGIDMSKIRFDRTLARGSDYYTGIIFEVKLTSGNMSSSVAGGGRYDELIPSYLPEKKKSKKRRKAEAAGKVFPKEVFPMIGFSFGLDRLMDLVDLDRIDDNVKRPVWVATIGKKFEQGGEEIDPLILKMRLVSRLQQSNIRVIYNTNSRKFNKEIRDAEDENCSYTLIIGEREYSNNMFKIKEMDTRVESEYSFEDLDKVINLLS